MWRFFCLHLEHAVTGRWVGFPERGVSDRLPIPTPNSQFLRSFIGQRTEPVTLHPDTTNVSGSFIHSYMYVHPHARRILDLVQVCMMHETCELCPMMVYVWDRPVLQDVPLRFRSHDSQTTVPNSQFPMLRFPLPIAK